MKKIFCAVVVFAAALHAASGNAQVAEKEKVSTKAVAKAAPVVAPETAKAPAVVKPVQVVIPETAKAPDVKAKIAPAPAEQKKMSKEDMVARVKEMCQYRPDMLQAIPGLVMKEVEGKKTYEFKGKKLEDLDEGVVTNLFREVNRFISFQNTQRFEQQMKAIKQIDDINRIQRSLRKPYVPNVPKTYTPPKAYIPSTKPYRAPGK